MAEKHHDSIGESIVGRDSNVRFLCRIGFHKWVTVRRESVAFLRCLARNEVRGRRGGVVTGLRDGVVDRECLCCGKQDFRVDDAKRAVLAEERIVWEIISKHHRPEALQSPTQRV